MARPPHKKPRLPYDKRRYFKEAAAVYDTRYGAYLFYLLDVLDGKTSALLTHISVVLAAVALVFSTTRPGLIEQVFLGAEVVSCIVVALLCLRCLYLVGPKVASVEPDSIQDRLEQTVLSRRRSYVTALYLAGVTTAIFAVTLICVVYEQRTTGPAPAATPPACDRPSGICPASG